MIIIKLDKKLRPSTSGLLKKLNLGNYPTKDIRENEVDIIEDNASSASYKQNKEKFENEINNKIQNLNRNILNGDNEIVKNYGSFNSLSDINKLTNQMAFNKANLNTNDFFSTKKSNTLSKKSKNKNETKKIKEKNKLQSSYSSSSLSSLESDLYYYDKNNNNKIKNELESSNINMKNSVNKIKENETDGNN